LWLGDCVTLSLNVNAIVYKDLTSYKLRVANSSSTRQLTLIACV